MTDTDPPSGTCRKIASGSAARSIHVRGVRLLVVCSEGCQCRVAGSQQQVVATDLQATARSG